MYRILLAGVALFAAASVSISAQSPAAVTAQTASKGLVRRGVTPSILPGTQESAFTTIQGNALSSTNGQLANSLVRLRDARLGRIVGSQITDRSGLFAFHAVDPGTYVVELVGNDQTVLAASQVLSVNAGDVASAVVRLPFKIPPFAGLLGHSATQATALSSAAAASGVLAENVVTSSAAASAGSGTPPPIITDISPR
jgi:hypothetical protein